MRALPPIPRSVKLPTGRIPVRRSRTLHKKEQAVGKFDWAKRVMYIDADLDVHAAWLTLEHEIVHAILMDSGVSELLPHEIEERICDAIAAARVAERLSR